MTTIAVSGAASAEYPAEVGVAQILVTVDNPDAAAAAEAAAAVHTRLVQEVQRNSGVRSWSAESVYTRTVSSRQEYEDAVEHRAQASLLAEFTDFDALSEWVSTIAGIPEVGINRISWELTTATRQAAERAIRVEAVHDAKAKAEAYASALDMRRPHLVAVYEPGLRPGVPSGSGYVGAAARSAGLPADVFQLKPAPIRVSAQITADFHA